MEARKANLDLYASDAKAKTTESMDDLASKFMNIRPIKYERSPAKDQAIKSLKSVKQKYAIKCESQK
jgi:hypothetical protein